MVTKKQKRTRVNPNPIDDQLTVETAEGISSLEIYNMLVTLVFKPKRPQQQSGNLDPRPSCWIVFHPCDDQ